MITKYKVIKEKLGGFKNKEIGSECIKIKNDVHKIRNLNI